MTKQSKRLWTESFRHHHCFYLLRHTHIQHCHFPFLGIHTYIERDSLGRVRVVAVSTKVKWFLASNSSNGLKAFYIIFNCHYYFPTFFSPSFRVSTFHIKMLALSSHHLSILFCFSLVFLSSLVGMWMVFTVAKFTAVIGNFLVPFSISISFRWISLTITHKYTRTMWPIRKSFILAHTKNTFDVTIYRRVANAKTMPM